MPRALAPCGTPAAYRRHLRHGEKPCAACARAHGARKNERAASASDRVAEVTRLNIADRRAAPSESFDPLAKAIWNLNVLEARMEAGGSDVDRLSKRHMELVAEIARMQTQSKPKESALDQLARRRADRLAAASD